jgi:hypothetical protein
MYGTALFKPVQNLASPPNKKTPVPERDHRTRHVGIAALVAAHAVALSEAEEISDTLSIDEVISVDDGRHRNILYVC